METFASLAADLDIPELRNIEGKVPLDVFSKMTVDQMAALGLDRQSHLKIRRYYITKEKKYNSKPSPASSQPNSVDNTPRTSTPVPMKPVLKESSPLKTNYTDDPEVESPANDSFKKQVEDLISLNKELLSQNKKLFNQVQTLKGEIETLKTSVPSLSKLVQNHKQALNKLSDEMAAMRM